MTTRRLGYITYPKSETLTKAIELHYDPETKDYTIQEYIGDTLFAEAVTEDQIVAYEIFADEAKRLIQEV